MTGSKKATIGLLVMFFAFANAKRITTAELAAWLQDKQRLAAFAVWLRVEI